MIAFQVRKVAARWMVVPAPAVIAQRAVAGRFADSAWPTYAEAARRCEALRAQQHRNLRILQRAKGLSQ